MICDVESCRMMTDVTEGEPAKQLVDPVRAFVLLPVAHLELMHTKEFEALESKTTPSTTAFLIRIFMPLADPDARQIHHDETTTKLFQERSRIEDGEEQVHGVEMYLCPETDKGTEKLFMYLLTKSRETMAHSIPLPSDWGLVYKKQSIVRHVEEPKQKSQSLHGLAQTKSAIPDTVDADDETEDERDADEDTGVLMEGNLRVKAHNELWFREQYCVLSSDGVLKLYEDLDAYLSRAAWQHSVMCRGASVEEDAALEETEGYSFCLVNAMGHRYSLNISVHSASSIREIIPALRKRVQRS